MGRVECHLRESKLKPRSSPIVGMSLSLLASISQLTLKNGTRTESKLCGEMCKTCSIVGLLQSLNLTKPHPKLSIHTSS